VKLRPLSLWWPASIGLAFAFWGLAVTYHNAPRVLAFDAVLTTWLRDLRSPELTSAFFGLTLLGATPFVVAAVSAVAAVWISNGRRILAVYVTAVSAGGGLLVLAFKDLIGRERPPLLDAVITPPPSASFPSGHSMGGLVLAWAVCYPLLRHAGSQSRVRTLALVVSGAMLTLLVGASRVYLGVHWPSDVVASWLLGGAWIALVTGVYETVLLRSREEV
jgi:membrane-associated phospholipid phosphatase